MKQNKLQMFTVLFTAAALFAGCTAEPNPDYVPAEPDNVPGVADRTAFALGADISWTTQMESEGLKFYNAEGTETECTALMKELGMNSIRLRVWVDPEQGWSSKGDVVAKALRARKLGMRIMIDFHYSDIWADPGKQVVPSAWLDHTNEELAQDVRNHTSDVLTTLKKAGVDVEWVQVGNEITYGMMMHSGLNDSDRGIPFEDRTKGGSTANKTVLASFVQAGYDAVKSVYPDALVVIHVDQGHYLDRGKAVFEALAVTPDKKYDVIGLSLYPNSAAWQDRTEACIENINTLSGRYGCKIMICETGMPQDNQDAAYDMLSYLIEKAEATGNCLGVFYWEPQCDGYNGYNMGAFSDGAPAHALDAFTEASLR